MRIYRSMYRLAQAEKKTGIAITFPTRIIWFLLSFIRINFTVVNTYVEILLLKNEHIRQTYTHESHSHHRRYSFHWQRTVTGTFHHFSLTDEIICHVPRVCILIKRTCLHRIMRQNYIIQVVYNRFLPLQIGLSTFFSSQFTFLEHDS